MLPTVDGEGRLTGRLAFLYAAALLPVTAALTVAGVSGGWFLAASQLAGLAFLGLGWIFLRDRSLQAARRVFLASILYLPIVLGLSVADRTSPIPASRSAATVATASFTPTAAEIDAPPGP